MKKKILIGGIIAAAVGVCVTVFLYFFLIRSIDVFGKEFPVGSEEIALSGESISGMDELTEILKPFHRLKKLDLGDYTVNVKEEERFNAAFPQTELICRRVVDLYGETTFCDSTEVDLTGKDLSDLTKLRAALPYFTRLERVVSGDGVIPLTELESLEKDFPGVRFCITALVDVYGQTLRSDVTEIDLKGAAVGADLADLLAHFPDLKEVDLHGAGLAGADQLALAEAFPDVTFAWEVELFGTVYDYTVEELDFTGNTDATPDLIRKYARLFPCLKRLDMSECGASDEEMAALREDLPGVKVVWRLYMGDFTLKTDDVTFAVLIRKDDPRKQLRSEDIQVLRYCTDLRALDLGHQLITDISVIGDYLPELRVLILADNQITDISPLSKLKHLHYLELFVNGRGLCDLTPLASCRELVDLNISYLYGFKDFSPLMDLPLLERLWLENTSVTKGQLKELENRYPNAVIVTEGKGSVDQGWRTHRRYYAMLDMFYHNYLSEAFSKYDR